MQFPPNKPDENEQPQSGFRRGPMRVPAPLDQFPQYTNAASIPSRVQRRESDPALSSRAFFEQMPDSVKAKLGATYNEGTKKITVTQQLGPASKARQERYEINRDDRTGLLTVNNASSPSRGFVVTGRVSFETGKETDATTELHSFLSRAADSRNDSLVKMIQRSDIQGTFANTKDDFSGDGLSATNVHFGHLTAQQRAKWASAKVVVSDEKKTLYASDMLDFQERNPHLAGFRGSGKHVFDPEALNAANFPRYKDAQGQQISLGGKSNKREQNQGVHETFTYLSAPNIVQPTTMWGARYEGQSEVNEGTVMTSFFDLHTGAQAADGTAFIREDSGFLGNQTTQNFNITPAQAALINEGKHNEALGYAPQDVFQHRRGFRFNENDQLREDTNIREGLWDEIPNLPSSGAGSYAFTNIDNIRAIEHAPGEFSAEVTSTKNIRAWEGSAKFGAKDSLVPVKSDSPLLNQTFTDAWGNRSNEPIDIYRNAPDSKDAANLALHSLLSTNTTDELQEKFTRQALSIARQDKSGNILLGGDEGYDSAKALTKKRANSLFNGGVIGGDNTRIFDNMARQHLADSYRVRTSDEPMRFSRDAAERYGTFDDKGNFTSNTFVDQITQETRPFISDHKVDKDGSVLGKYTTEGFLLSKSERLKPEFDSGSHLLSDEMLNNMAIANRPLYDNLRQREAAGLVSNPARDLLQSVSANFVPETRKLLEDRGKVVDFADSGFGSVIAGMPEMENPNDYTVELMKRMAKTEYGDKSIRMGERILPSAKSALSNLTRDKEGEIVKTFGQKWVSAMHMAQNEQEFKDLGSEDTSAIAKDRDSMAYDAVQAGAALANTESVLARSYGMELPMLGGTAMAIQGLQANEAVISRDSAYRMAGVYDLPEEQRGDAKKAALKAIRDGSLTMNPTMHPHSVQDKVYPNFKVSLIDEVRKRQGMEGIADPGNNLFLSHEGVTFFRKDTDADPIMAFMSRKLGMVDGKMQWVGDALQPTSAGDVREHASKAIEEVTALKEGASRDFRTYMGEVDSSRQRGSDNSTLRDNRELIEGYKEIVGSKSEVGKLYNMGIRGHQAFAREQSAQYVNQASSPEEAALRQSQSDQYDSSISYLSEKAYQTSTKLSINQDEGVKAMLAIENSLSFNNVKGAGRGSWITRDGESGKVAGSETTTGLSSFIINQAVKYNQSAEDYDDHIAPNLARALMPLGQVDNQEMHSKVLGHLMQAKESGEFNQEGYLKDIGFEGNPSAAVFGDNSDDMSREIPFLRFQGSASIAKMIDNMESGKNVEAGAKILPNLSSKMKAGASLLQNIREYSKVRQPEGAMEQAAAISSIPTANYQHTRSAAAQIYGEGAQFPVSMESALAQQKPISDAPQSAMMEEVASQSGIASSVRSVMDGVSLETPESMQVTSAPFPYEPVQAQTIAPVSEVDKWAAASGPSVRRYEPGGNVTPSQSRRNASMGDDYVQHLLSDLDPANLRQAPTGGGGNAGQPPEDSNSGYSNNSNPGGGTNIGTQNVNYLQARLGSTSFNDVAELSVMNKHLERFKDLMNMSADATKKMTPLQEKELEIGVKQFELAKKIQTTHEQRMQNEDTSGARMSAPDRLLSEGLLDKNGRLTDELNNPALLRKLQDYQAKKVETDYNEKIEALRGEDNSIQWETLMQGGKAGRKARSKAFEAGVFDNFAFESKSEADEALNRNIAGIAGGAGRFAEGLTSQGTIWRGKTVMGLAVNPVMQAAESYMDTQARNQALLMQGGALSFTDAMNGQFGDIRRLNARREQAEIGFGRQAYDAWSPLIGSFTNPEMAGGIAGGAASILAPSIGAGLMTSQVLAPIMGAAAPIAGLAVGGAVAAYAGANYINAKANDAYSVGSGLRTSQAEGGNFFTSLWNDFGGTMALAGSGFDQITGQETEEERIRREASPYYANKIDYMGANGGNLLTEAPHWSMAANKGQFVSDALNSYLNQSASQLGMSGETALGAYSYMSRYSPGELPTMGERQSFQQMTDMGIDPNIRAQTLVASRNIAPWDATGLQQAQEDAFAQASAESTVSDSNPVPVVAYTAGNIAEASFGTLQSAERRYNAQISGISSSSEILAMMQPGGKLDSEESLSAWQNSMVDAMAFSESDRDFYNSGGNYVLGQISSMNMDGNYSQAARTRNRLGSFSNVFNEMAMYGNSTQIGANLSLMALNDNNLSNSQTLAMGQGDSTLLSQNYASMGADARFGPNNIRLRTMNTQTGMGIFDENIDAAGVQQLRDSDQFGRFNLTNREASMGELGWRNESLQISRDAEAYDYNLSSQQRQVSQGLQFGGGTVGPDSFMQGGNLNDAKKVFEELGMAFMEGIEGSSAYGMNFSQLEDASRSLSREQQDYGMQIQEQMMGDNGFRARQLDQDERQFYEKFGLNETQFNWQNTNQRADLSRNRSHQVTQQQWASEDWSFNRSSQELQFGWQMQDSDRNLRYARGRERVDLMRQQERNVIQNSMQMAHSDIEKDRMGTQNKWSEEEFKINRKRMEESISFRKQEMDMSKRHFQEDMRLKREQFGLDQQQHEKKKSWLIQERQLEDQRILLERQNQQLSNQMTNASAEYHRNAQLESQRYADALMVAGQEQQRVGAMIGLTAKNGELLNIALGNVNATIQSMLSVSKDTKSTIAPPPPTSGGKMVKGYSHGGNVDAMQLASFNRGGYTGDVPKNAVAGVVHGQEYVVPQSGSLVVRNDGMARDMSRMVELLEKLVNMGMYQMNTNIYTNEKSMKAGDLYDKVFQKTF